MRFIIKLMLISLTFFNIALSSEIEISVRPGQPILGDSFNVIFDVKFNGSEKPFISFDPDKLTVLGKSNRGIQQTTVYVGGKLSSHKKITYSYEMVAPKAGNFYLRNIIANIDGKEVKHSDYRVKVLSKPMHRPDIFVEAEISKDNAYIGEGIELVYYVYSVVNIETYEILEFPNLGSFLKRNVQVKRRTSQRVELGGRIYVKEPLYKTKIFPRKKGTVNIGAIKIRVQYRLQDRYNPFFGTTKSKSLISTIKQLKVLPLPREGLPPSFTGLIGRHSFKFTMPRSKFLVNEAIESKLEVTGPGLLEDFSAPTILESPGLEEFDAKFDISFDPNGDASKVFEYTHLGRSAVALNEKSFPLSYFDPDNHKFETVQISVPKLVIAGGAITKPTVKQNSNQDNQQTIKTNTQVIDEIVIKRGLIAPFFKEPNIISFWPKLVNLILAIVLIIFLIIKYISTLDSGSKKSFAVLYKELLKKPSMYGNIFKMAELLREKKGIDAKKSPQWIFENSGLSKEAALYFCQLLDDSELATFRDSSSSNKIVIKKPFFNELKKVI